MTKAMSAKTQDNQATIVWIGFDLGIGGDYEGMFAWLDGHDAKDCGEELAVLTLPRSSNPADILRKSIAESVKVDKATRIYIVYRDTETNKNVGKFLFGGRKQPRWAGYAQKFEDLVDEGV